MTRHRLGLTYSVLALTLLAAPLVAQGDKVLVNVDKKGVALQGYDAVAFFTDQAPVRGVASYSARYQGATYYFASAEHRATFESAPEHYAPGYGGFCAYGASQKHAAPVEISTWQVIKDRLILNYSAGVQRTFNKDQEGYLAKADANWPGLVESEGKAAAP